MRKFKSRLWFYRVSAFVSGMSVMAIELAASRLLAPYFSSSLPVWAVIIGIIMAAMSLGNYRGGRLADRAAQAGSDAPLYTRMLIAAIWIAAIPLVGKYLILLVAAVAAVIAGNQVMIVGSLLACLLLFAAPMLLLGMVSPFLVRMATVQAEGAEAGGSASTGERADASVGAANGSSATALAAVTARPAAGAGAVTGSIYAWGTMGSILGTFFASFVTIPDAGVARTYLLFAAVLALLVLIRALTERTRFWPAAVATICCLALLAAPLGANYAFWENDVLYQGESSYNYLLVRQDTQTRYFSTNVLFGVQSMLPRAYLAGDRQASLSGEYYDGMIGACGLLKNFNPTKPIRMLMLGLGTGTCPTLLQQALPGSTCTGVEIDAKIVQVAHDYFALTPQDCHVVVGDGRSYLQQHKEKYDLILVDAYQDVAVPFQMATREFYALAASRLEPGGALACNVNMGTRNNGAVTGALISTMSSVFGQIYAAEVPGSSNTLLYAVPGGDLSRLQSSLQKCVAAREAAEQVSAVSGGSGAVSAAGAESQQGSAGTEGAAGASYSSLAATHLVVLQRCIQQVADNARPVTSSARVLTDDCAPVEILANKALGNLIAEERAQVQQEVKDNGGGLRGWWSYAKTLIGD